MQPSMVEIPPLGIARPLESDSPGPIYQFYCRKKVGKISRVFIFILICFVFKKLLRKTTLRGR